MINLTLSVNQTIALTLNPQSFSGKIGSIQNVSWKTISGKSTIQPSPDGLTAIITASPKPGVTVFLIGGNTNKQMVTQPKMVNSGSQQSAIINADDVVYKHGGFVFNQDGFIYNQITINVVETRADTAHDSTTTNLGISVGSPQD
jgi:hypothetical protein